MEKTRKIRCFTTFIILIILIIILLIMNECIGTVHISFKAAFATLYDHSDRVGRIVWDIRMPRAIAAMILGGALALAGYLLQTFFHNPIAGPFVLGISSGAKMIVALVMVFLLGNAIRVSSLAMIAAAFLGAMLSMGFVLIISRKVSSMSMLVVSGVMIGYICSAVTEFVVTFADDSDIVNLHNWSRGSFSGMTWDSVGVMSIVVGITFIFVFLMSRAIAAMILGGALALAGYLLQTFFHNPIAGPFVLGISSGAKMIVALVMVFLLGNAIRVSSLAMIAAAFLGAMLSMGFVLIISRKVSSMSMLVVSGVMIGYICSAVTEFVVTFADDSDIVNLHNWSRGSFSGMTWDSVGVMSIVVGITFIFVFLMSKPLMAYQLGESYAVNLGVNIKRIRVLLVLLSSLLSACIVAFAGPISFVGIAVPHIVKSMLKSTKPIYMIPACFLGGAVFCLFCDLLARMMFAPTELSISTVTAVFGAPVVLFIMIRRSKEKNV